MSISLKTEPKSPVQYGGGARPVLRPILFAQPIGLLAILFVGGRRVSDLELVGPAALILAALCALLFLTMGRARAASGVVVVALIGCGLSTMVGYGSVRSVGSFALLGAVVVAGIFHGRRVLIGTVVLSSVLIALLVYAEINGIMTSLNRPIGAFHGVSMSITFVLSGFAVHYSRALATTSQQSLQRELCERAQTERSLRSMEERLRLSMEATRQGWFDLDLTSGAVNASAQFARMIGADPDRPQMSQQNWIASIYDEDRPAVMAAFAECLASADTRQMEYRWRTRQGENIWIRSIAKVVQWDDAGRPLRMTGTHADITDQMRVTLALRQSERQYRSLVELSPVAILVQRDGMIVYANVAASTLLGAVSPEVLVGSLFFARVHPDDYVSMQMHCPPDAILVSASPSIEGRFIRLDGQTVEVSVQCTPISFEGASAVQFSCTNISARKRAEASLLRSRQLESLGTLAGGIAHDFNNIIQAIRGNAELAAAEVAAGHAAEESLNEISRASARASEIVRRITAFGRPKESNRVQIALPIVVDEVLKLLRPAIPASIAFDVSMEESVPDVWGDSAQIHEALVNLTANAADAIGHKNVGTISYALSTVSVCQEEAEALGLQAGCYVRLSVTDNGRGMDASTMSRAFDAFYTTKPIGEGSGLGLSMVYGILKGHDGAVIAESMLGEGASFHLYLPAAVGTRRPKSETSAVVVRVPVSRRVLFVDDEAPLVNLAKRMLRRAGHSVEGFTNPESALDVLRARPADFDIIVTDLTMPLMSGLELARAARAIRADIPVVMATGDANATDEAELAEAGIRFVAVKATESNQLVRLVERAFRD